jgi:methanogenic corrinoid protein MtbC1
VWERAQPPLDAALLALHEGKEGHALYALPPAHALARGYLQAILKGNRLIAQQFVMDAARNGMPLRQIYLEVFQPALYEVGRLWETGRVSVAQEHLATAITQTILSTIYAEALIPAPTGQRAIVACLSGNYHEIGARMVADLLQLSGFDALFLGANTPEQSFLEMVDDLKPQVIGLPSSLPRHVEQVRATIAKVRGDFATDRPTILVGGLAFNQVDALWRQVGGDVSGRDAGEAVDHLIGTPA